MKSIPLNPETEPVVRRLVWFESPEEALADPVRFMAYAMARAAHEDMKIIRHHVDDADFLEALDKAPPGIILGVLEFEDGSVSGATDADSDVPLIVSASRR